LVITLDLSNRTRKRLDEIKKKGENYNDVVNRLLNEHKAYRNFVEGLVEIEKMRE
jgi:hypothetical protein